MTKARYRTKSRLWDRYTRMQHSPLPWLQEQTLTNIYQAWGRYFGLLYLMLKYGGDTFSLVQFPFIFNCWDLSTKVALGYIRNTYFRDGLSTSPNQQSTFAATKLSHPNCPRTAPIFTLQVRSTHCMPWFAMAQSRVEHDMIGKTGQAKCHHGTRTSSLCGNTLRNK